MLLLFLTLLLFVPARACLSLSTPRGINLEGLLKNLKMRPLDNKKSSPDNQHERLSPKNRLFFGKRSKNLSKKALSANIPQRALRHLISNCNSADPEKVKTYIPNNNAPTEMMSVLCKLPDMKFNSAQDLINAIKGKL
jgi:hypothetical protein